MSSMDIFNFLQYLQGQADDDIFSTGQLPQSALYNP